MRPQFTRRQGFPLLLILAGLAIAVSCAWVASTTPGLRLAGTILGVAVVVAGSFWQVANSGHLDEELESLRDALVQDRKRFSDDQAKLTEIRQSLDAALQEQAQEMQRREQALASKLVTFHEWMEFPQPLQLEQSPEPNLQNAELARRDAQMLDLLAQETRRLFEDIRANKYVQNGRFQPLILRDEAWQLAERVARIYRPDAENPLLETSPELVLRAASRVCLHLLVILDELPLKVQGYNLNALYQYVRQAVRAYDMYKTVQPYWPYMNTAFYLSRLVLGANPTTLGTWWVVSEIGKRGAEKLAEHLVHRQGLALLHNLVRVVGFEVASLYGGDFRHRDANWIYAVELAELVHHFPLSRDSLSHALKEIGTLQLRSEYDRIYLYRCVASHSSASPEQFEAASFLRMEERQAVIRRLEKFYELFIHGRTSERSEKWRQGVEERLQIRLASIAAQAPLPQEGQRADAVRSLASFLVSIKEREAEELEPWLSSCRLWNDMTSPARASLLQQLRDNPPYFFEHPDVDPKSPLADQYLDDLARLSASLRPRAAATDELLADVAIYLRQNARDMHKRLRGKYLEQLEQRWHDGSPKVRVPTSVARGVLDLLEPGEEVYFAYDETVIEMESGGAASPLLKAPGWLIGLSHRLVFLADHAGIHPLWQGEGYLRPERVKGYFAQDCRIAGGTWLHEDVQGISIRVHGAKLQRFESYFEPLLSWCRRHGGEPSPSTHGAT